MSRRASCGHYVEKPGRDEWDLVAIKFVNFKDEKKIHYLSLCDGCYSMYITCRLVLHTQVEEEEYLDGN